MPPEQGELVTPPTAMRCWIVPPLDLDRYRLQNPSEIMTPALLVYPEMVDGNIAATLRAIGGDPRRWRPHLKTVKMPWVVRKLLDAGVETFKCATTRELRMVCETGARDVLLAYPTVGVHSRRVAEIAKQFPGVRVSVLVENCEQIAFWANTSVGIFVDVNPGMDRTGIARKSGEAIVSLARELGPRFRGIHYYDGHVSAADLYEREMDAHTGYRDLLQLATALEHAGLAVEEIITSGTPAFPYGISFAGFRDRHFIHRVSPGTVLFNDVASLSQLPAELGYQPAAFVLATVVSHPLPHRITCDAGHKSVSADAGVPTCAVLGCPTFQPLKPSEEHLPIDIPPGETVPRIGDTLYLLPRHICPTVNLFDEAVLIRAGAVDRVEPVTARGHDPALV